MDRPDHYDYQPGQEQTLEVVQTCHIRPHLVPVGERGQKPQGNDGGGESYEVGREDETDLADKRLKEAVGIESPEPEVKKASTDSAATASGRNVVVAINRRLLGGNQLGFGGNQLGLVGNLFGFVGHLLGLIGTLFGLMGRLPGLIGDELGLVDNLFGLAGALPRFLIGGLQEAVGAKRVDEFRQDFRVKRRLELLLDPLSDYIRWGCSVELAGNEELDLADAEELAGRRVFDDIERPPLNFPVAGDEVASELCLSG